MKTKTGNAILKILRQHQGRAEVITSEAICRELGIPESREREVRRTIADENALWPDVVVCAVPGHGFFCAATYDEMLTYDNWLGQLVTRSAEKQSAFRAAAKRLGFNIKALPPMLAAA